MTPRLLLTICVLALMTRSVCAQHPKPDGHYDYPVSSEATQDTADEPFTSAFSAPKAAAYLDSRAHLVESNCLACHSTYSHMAARSLIDPLAMSVMESRVMLERYVDETKTRTHEKANRILAAAELARHDGLTTGHLQPATRKALDYMWRFQEKDGGVIWLHVGEAPSAIDDYYGVATMAIGAGLAPDGYAQTDKAKAGVEKLRGWFHTHPPTTLHERALTLIADAAIGGVANAEARAQHAEAIFAKQLADGGWSVATVANWTRKDKAPLDATRSDGMGTGYMALALARGGIPVSDERLHKAVEWLKRNQRRTGGWFTRSPFKKDIIASNAGSSFAVQALAACGEIATPRITSDQFNSALATANKTVPPGVSATPAVAKAQTNAKAPTTSKP